MEKQTVTVEARILGLIPRAFQEIKGPRPIMLSYKIGEILKPVIELQTKFVEALKPYVVEGKDGGGLREDLTEEEEAKVEALVREEITFEIPQLNMDELLLHEDLTCGDDTVFSFLVDNGIIGA